MKSENILHNRIRTFRLNLNLTQNELAERVGTTQNTISAIENGFYNASPSLAYKLCKSLHCKFEDLFYELQD